ncbi:MAG: hypothetical protein HUJ73_06515 [Eubacterium sp.]|nr:hypothetical protein [Eubacterium sp.]
MKAKHWIIGWLIIVVFGLVFIGTWVGKIDPYFHFHNPDTETYFYSLDNERSQNDGITKHFDYDAIITGTSMTENFKTSEMDEIFECHSIKVPYSGGSYKEINDNLEIAVSNNPDLKTVVRCLDMTFFFYDKDWMREDLGEFPDYLYDSNPLNDVRYIWNRDVIWKRAYAMTAANDEKNFKPGITSFDDYARWQDKVTFGVNTVCPDGVDQIEKAQDRHITEEEKSTIYKNIEQNVTQIAKDNPDITFYYFFPPYSIVWWRGLAANGNICKQIEAEEYIIELITECDNIKLFSFNNRQDITTDLNHYKDNIHYGEWINSLILRWMKDGKYQITKGNYKDYIRKESEFYKNYDYMQINGQVDYEDDYYAAALLLNKEYTG